MHRNVNYTIKLMMHFIVGVILVIVDEEYLVGILNKLKGIFLCAANAEKNGTGSTCIAQNVHSFVDGIWKLNDIS